MDAVLCVHRKVYDGAVHHWSRVLCALVPRVPPRVRGREMVHRRTATSWKVSNMGILNRLQERALAVGRTFIFFGVLVALPLAPALRADLVFTSDGRTDRF